MAINPERVVNVVDKSDPNLWHGRLGHMSQARLDRLMGIGYIPKLQTTTDFYEHCQYGKQTRSPHSLQYETIWQPLELVHTDICGPMPKRTLGGSWYFITFVDNCTQKVWAYSIKSKDEALEAFTQWISEVENISGYRVKALRYDNGGEYTSRAFKQYLSNKGILHQKTVPYTPMQNGLAEQINRTIEERVTAMLQQARVKLEFWAEALQTAVYLINMAPSKAIRLEVPQALWPGKQQPYDRLRIFGCEAYVFIPRDKRRSWHPMQQIAYFSMMEPMGTSTTVYGTLRTGNWFGAAT